jgi:tetrahydromethanopterin S-methyltransferase subunit B
MSDNKTITKEADVITIKHSQDRVQTITVDKVKEKIQKLEERKEKIEKIAMAEKKALDKEIEFLNSLLLKE